MATRSITVKFRVFETAALKSALHTIATLHENTQLTVTSKYKAAWGYRARVNGMMKTKIIVKLSLTTS